MRLQQYVLFETY